MGIVKGALAQSNALDDLQADRYYPDSRMTLSIIKNIERKVQKTVSRKLRLHCR